MKNIMQNEERLTYCEKKKNSHVKSCCKRWLPI